MTAMGHQRHFEHALSMSALPLIATELLHDGKWRDGPKGDNRPVQRQL